MRLEASNIEFDIKASITSGGRLFQISRAAQVKARLANAVRTPSRTARQLAQLRSIGAVAVQCLSLMFRGARNYNNPDVHTQWHMQCCLQHPLKWPNEHDAVQRIW